ncbi:MAG: cytochrome B [Candidatus Omnitrophota bacterium]
MSKPKPKVAFFEFTDCEGCQLQVANLGAGLLELAKVVDIVNFREIMSEAGQEYDVLVVEGSVASRHDEERLKKIASKAKVIVALGACATIGGVNNLKNLKSLEEQKKAVYGDIDPVPDAIETKAIDEVVKVDYYVHGCPIYGPEFLKVMECVLLGKPYNVPQYPVCVECKQNENVCVYEKGQFCLGPVTKAGCNSWLPNYGSVCVGCRGLIDNPAADAQKDILQKYGLTVEGILDKFTLYCNGKKERAKYGEEPKK